MQDPASRPRTATHTINGARLVVDDSGGVGLPGLITLHGAPGMSSRRNDWEVFQAFTDRCRVVSYDQRGSGESSVTPPFDHTQLTADADALREWLDLGDEIVVAGGSYGGFLALEYALRYRRHVRAVVLRDTAAHHGFHGEARRRALASPYPMDVDGLDRLFAGRTRSDEDFRALIRMIMPLYTTRHDPDRDARQVEAMAIHHETHNWAFSRNQPGYDLRDRLSALDVPVLVTVGRHDWITPLAASEEIVTLLPDAELVVFEHSGHGPQDEERDGWTEVVRDFLARRAGA